ncbi:hypothetical protein Lsan_0773 [Legionella santicrucis]|uniref:YetF C-terminal domain-containing protein n=1 Tax=Legionella santicrucis TaxID=45074 RepID=A0A0W0Z9L2_9GAMM|nr:YetF domain-containing protein [Legionella santicrucis]KTD65619.1 hypothetical protein Lsan_0773 [Legionella santicrucis]
MLYFYLSKINSDHNLIYIIIRTIIIYIYAIFLIRIGNRRFNLQTSFDFVLVIIMGSVLSRAVNGSSTLVASMAGSGVIIFLHWLFAFGAFQHHKIGILLKGKPIIVIKDGEIDWNVLKRNQITEEDLRESLRQALHHDELHNVKEARLERTGQLSFILNTTTSKQ